MILIIGKVEETVFLSIKKKQIISFDDSFSYKEIYSITDVDIISKKVISKNPIIKIFPNDYSNSLKEALVCLAIIRKNKKN